MLLGIDTFSLRWQGWDAFQMLDYAASQGFQNIHFSERANLESHEPAFLESLKVRADDLKLRIEIGMRSFNKFSTTFDATLGSGEQQLADMIAVARILGSPVVRCFVGMQADRGNAVSLAHLIDESIRTLRAAAPFAKDAGIAIAVENHGGVDLLAHELRSIIEEVDSTAVGACLDTGNPLYGGEDAVLATEILAPYVVTAHVRDTRVWATETGCAVQWVPAGQGDVDLQRIVAILREHTPDIALDLEIITGVGPKAIDYLIPNDPFWQFYPEMKARDFARFLTLTTIGTTGPLDQLQLADGVWTPHASELEAFQTQQRHHLEESIAYSRDVLGLG
jgi:sugar phosphate isomerase/epimerase